MITTTLTALLTLLMPPDRFPLPRPPYEMPRTEVYYIGPANRRRPWTK